MLLSHVFYAEPLVFLKSTYWVISKPYPTRLQFLNCNHLLKLASSGILLARCPEAYCCEACWRSPVTPCLTFCHEARKVQQCFVPSLDPSRYCEGVSNIEQNPFTLGKLTPDFPLVQIKHTVSCISLLVLVFLVELDSPIEVLHERLP